MKRVILFGASGNAGKMIAAELRKRNYELTAVVRSQKKAEELKHITTSFIIAEATNPQALKGICNGFDIVISSLGKSVSPNDKSKPSFREIDFSVNERVLREALNAGVKKFVYLSVFYADKYPDLEYFKTHHDFEESLKRSGIDYSIVRPPAIFCSFVDLMDMAKKGRLITMGKGDKRTNPIYEGDLAKVVVDSIGEHKALIEAGGKEILSRKQINEIIQNGIAPGKKVRTVPMGLIKSSLPVIRVFSRNMYDKMAFFAAVMQHDPIAPRVGEMRLEEYVKMKAPSVRD